MSRYGTTYLNRIIDRTTSGDGCRSWSGSAEMCAKTQRKCVQGHILPKEYWQHQESPEQGLEYFLPLTKPLQFHIGGMIARWMFGKVVVLANFWGLQHRTPNLKRIRQCRGNCFLEMFFKSPVWHVPWMFGTNRKQNFQSRRRGECSNFWCELILNLGLSLEISEIGRIYLSISYRLSDRIFMRKFYSKNKALD